MQTNLADFIADTHAGREANGILRKCVHCGFCTATCPTYQLLGDELDGPRGRIYLIKQVLEGNPATASTRRHLDRCLTCRNCESTCPSGVEYGRLVEIGREVVEHQAPRPWPERLLRAALRTGLSNTALFETAMKLGLAVRRWLPEKVRATLHAPRAPGIWPSGWHSRRMVVLRGCVQPAMAPRINAAAARVLDRLGITLYEVPGAACCGALPLHTSALGAALDNARTNIDRWIAELDRGAEAIVMTASGCGATVKEYAKMLAEDGEYAERARRVAAHTRDLSEIVAAEPLAEISFTSLAGRRLAFHPPCSLQHAQKLPGVVEHMLTSLGVELTPVPDSHLCCGSAGSYSILQPVISAQLRSRKLANLEAGEPDEILTANVGCMHHLQSGTRRPVRHWVELLDDALLASAGASAE
ncbi:MAG: glycolate oxidase subunit GlcF [Pseudomonadota bacterium]